MYVVYDSTSWFLNLKNTDITSHAKNYKALIKHHHRFYDLSKVTTPVL